MLIIAASLVQQILRSTCWIWLKAGRSSKRGPMSWEPLVTLYIVSLRRSLFCWQNGHALPIESAVRAAKAIWRITRPWRCSGEGEREHGWCVCWYVIPFHSLLGKTLTAFYVISEQQLEEWRPMGWSEVAGDCGSVDGWTYTTYLGSDYLKTEGDSSSSSNAINW